MTYLVDGTALLTGERPPTQRQAATRGDAMHAPIRMTTIVTAMLDAGSPRLVAPRHRAGRRAGVRGHQS